MLKTTLTLALALAASVVIAGEKAAPVVETKKEKSELEKLWDLPKLYKNKDNPVIQEFSLQGRLHLQYATGSSDEGSYGSEDRPDENLWSPVEVRRWRLGFKSTWFHNFKLEGLIDISPTWDPEFYDDIYSLFVTWEQSEAFNLSVGKMKVNYFGLEHGTSSNEILTIERGLLSNALFPGELTGARFNGKANGWLYGAAVFAGDEAREFTQDADGEVVQAYIGRNLKDQTGLDKAIIRLDYQYGTDSANNGGGGAFEHAFSINANLAKDQWGLLTEAVFATGRDTQGDVFGVYILPSYNISDDLQVVARYQYAHGDNDGLRLQSRYERLAPDLTDGGRGENYHAAYLGLNYYINGHKLKLMAGTEYHHMDGGGDGGDFGGWTSTVGLRLSF